MSSVEGKNKGIAELKERYIQYYKDLPVQKYAAMYVGRDEDTIKRWREDDADFADRVNLARAEWVKQKASKAKVEFALERLEKSIFKESKELEVKLPTPIMDLSDVQPNDSNKED